MKLSSIATTVCFGLVLGLSGIARAQQTGGLDTSFQFVPGAGGALAAPPSAYAIGPDGKVVVVGGFTLYHRADRKGVVRLNLDGTVDTTFDTKTGPGESVLVIPNIPPIKSPGFVTQVAVQPDGKIIVGGSFSSWNGYETKNVVRFNLDGSIDSTFKSTALAGGPMLMLPDGRFLICGKAGDFGAGRKTGLVRVNLDGSIDASFADSTLGTAAGTDAGQVTISQVRRQSDGKLAVTFAASKQFSPVYGVARLNENGTVDTTFKIGMTAGALSSLSSLSVDSSGRVFVVGAATSYDGQTVGKLFRLQADGALDKAFTPNLAGVLMSGVHAFADGTSLVTGSFTGIFGPVVKLNADGSRDATFGFTQSGAFGSIAFALCSDPKVAPGGEMYLSGSVTLLSGVQITQGNGVVRLTGTGNGGGGGGATAPTMTAQPVATSAVIGGSATFTVVASGTAPLSYQWKLNGKDVSGATTATLALNNITEASAGDYTVTITNLGGSVTSNPAKLTVNGPPRITSSPPAILTVGQGTSATLSVIAEGTAPLSYQWFKNGVAISGQTQSALTLLNVQATDAASYEVEVSNDFGKVRSTAAKLVLAPSAATWFLSSVSDGPGTITDLWLDGTRGVVVAGNYSPVPSGVPEFNFAGVSFPRPTLLNGFVARIDDAGNPMWSLPIVGDLSNGLTAETAVAVAADNQGNVFVAGPMRGQGDFAGLKVGTVGTEGTFVAKLDSAGKGLWSLMITGNLYERQLAVDPDGNVILTGRYTKRLDGPGFVLQAVDTGGCAVCKFNPAGATQWARSYQKGDSVGGSVDIYNVAADATGIYVAGAFNQSIRFGNYTEKLLALPYRDVGWLGKLNAAGEPQWLRSIGGSLPTDIALGANSVWVIGFSDPPSSQVLHGYRPDGTPIIALTEVARGSGSVLARGVSVDSIERPIFGGHAEGFASVGGLQLGIGQNPKLLWGAAANPAGAGVDGMMAGFLTVPLSGALAAGQFKASAQGDFYYTGYWSGTLSISSKSYQSAARKVFVTKVAGIPQPTVPVFTQQPQKQLFALGENRTLSATAKGGGLTFRWFKNGTPLTDPNVQVAMYPGARPGETSTVLTFIGITEGNAGDYTCEAANALGKTSSETAKVELGTKPVITLQPVAVRVNAGERISLKVEATGSGLNYQWQVVGGNLASATSPELVIRSATLADSGLYSVQVWNALGSVTSEEVRVTVCTGDPEPAFLGRSWVKILDDSTLVPGTTTRLGRWLSDDRPRFTLKDGTVHLVASAGSVHSLQPGNRALLRWRGGALETLVWTNTPVPGGGRFLDCFYPTDETDGGMNFTAFTIDAAGQTHAGLFELSGGMITKRLDDTTPLVGGAGHFMTFGSNVRRGGTMVGYPGTTGDPSGDGSGIYAVTASGFAPLIKATAALPSTQVPKLGFLPSNFGLSFDGATVIFAVGNEGLGQTGQAVFTSDLSGKVTRVLQTGDQFPGRPAGQVFTGFGAADVAGSTACFIAFDASRVGYLTRVRNGQLQVLASASTIAAGSADLVYANTAPNLISRYVKDGTTPETVLPNTALLECRRVKTVWQLDADGDDVVIGVDFADGGIAVFACVNPGSGTPPPQTLRVGRPDFVAGKLRVSIPTAAGKSYRIEFKPDLNTATWNPVQNLSGNGASQNVDLGATGGSGFYRVVEN